MFDIEVRHYLGRARDFLEGMKLLKDDLEVFRFSAALLAIHGAISYSDALRVGLGNDAVFADDHMSAASILRSLLLERRLGNLRGVQRLESLLAKKSRVAYSQSRLDLNEIALIVQNAERFAVWAETVGKELEIGGWRND